MNKKIGLVLVVLAAAVFLFGWKRMELKGTGQDVQPVEEEQSGRVETGRQETTEKALEGGQESGDDFEDELGEKALEEVSALELTGLNDEMLDVLGISKPDIASALKTWADKNGYASASGAAFYESMWIRFSESKYSIEFQMVMGDSGNGISVESGQVFTMDYYKGTGMFQFHK